MMTERVPPPELLSNGQDVAETVISVTSPGKARLHSWLNKSMKVEMTDGRVLIGSFLCTDRDANLILGSCTEYLNPQVCGFSDDPRILGLVMIPGRHIVSIHLDAVQQPSNPAVRSQTPVPLPENRSVV